MRDVFLSYAHDDDDIARAIEQRLERNRGVEVWTDSDLKAGDDWRRCLRDALRSADTYLFLLTPKFANSAFAQYEIGFADAQRDRHPERRMIPVLARGGRLSDAPAPLSSLISINAGEESDPDKIAAMVEEAIVTA